MKKKIILFLITSKIRILRYAEKMTRAAIYEIFNML